MEFPPQDYYQEGLDLEAGLREYMHTGTRPESLDLKRAGLWNQFSRKERKKLEGLTEQLVAEGIEAESADYQGEPADVDSEIDYTGVLAPSIMLAHLREYLAEPIGDDIEALIVVYLRESFEVMESFGDTGVHLLLNVAWAGYCARSIARAEVAEAREESMTTSLLEWNQEQSGDPMFVTAIGLAGASAGLGDKPFDDLMLRAGWITVPGLAVTAEDPAGDAVDAAVLPFEQLAFIGVKHAVELFSEEQRESAWNEGVTDAMLKSSWLLGYFLRVNEQYSPVEHLFDGARAYIYEGIEPSSGD